MAGKAPIAGSAGWRWPETDGAPVCPACRYTDVYDLTGP